jgi:hypothetical protein
MSDDCVMTVSHHGRLIGALVCEQRAYRLSWFDGADPRLVVYAGPLDSDAYELADRLAARLGARSATEAGLAVASAGL